MEFIYAADYEGVEEQLDMLRMRRQLRDSSNPLEMGSIMFKLNFRVTKEAFLYILGEITPKMRSAKLTTSIPVVIKLAATLRFCAQGSYQLSVGSDAQLGLAQSTTSVVLKEVLNALEDTICPKWIKFSVGGEVTEEAKLGFYRKSGFPGTIGCVDGTHVKIVSPRKELQHLYYNRKGFHSLNVMIVCDHQMRITYIDARHPGSCHDSMIFRTSSLASKLEDFARGNRNCWLLGDAGYALKPYMMTPFRNPEEGSPESEFNKKHASARCIVERTIGVFKNRFRCTLGARALHYAPDKATQIVNVCAALHNICIHYKVGEPEMEEMEEDDNFATELMDNDEHDTPRNEAEGIRNRVMISLS